MSADLKFEFKVDLKPIHYKSYQCRMAKISNELKLRQYLVLAHQIQETISEGKAKDLGQVTGWLGMTYTRIKQITNLLLLCPKIQEEILLINSDKILQITERKIRDITKEIDWQKQIILWNNLV
ncbi:MAG: hypothetical protein NTZ95_01485 [Candidatus Omnitrophica bacterium]|nr:hypothetical protein [Candidatus Omnitrophota bacterium]